VCLIPVLNFFKTYPIATDRFVFLPSIGLFFTVTAISCRKRFIVIPTVGLIITVIVVCSYISIRQSVYWKDNIVFLEYISNRDPSLNSFASLGMAYLNANNVQKSREAFLKALQYISESPSGASRGDILLMLGDNEGAIQAFESVLSRYKDSKELSYYVVSWQLYNNLSKAYMNTGNYPQAISAVENSIKLNPDNAGLYNSLGVLYGKTKQIDLAISAFEKAMALDSGYGFAPFNLAKTYLAVKDPKNAQKYLAIVRARFPNLRDEADLMGKNANLPNGNN
jgi:tetratricopeptide (TPR) repeat protein